jgi:hypothetical protein
MRVLAAAAARARGSRRQSASGCDARGLGTARAERTMFLHASVTRNAGVNLMLLALRGSGPRRRSRSAAAPGGVLALGLSPGRHGCEHGFVDQLGWDGW